ncbi:MAG TPA: hypothetical protein VF520_13390 [Thermoleophilaceae bacterium]|jgi:hypothetical protein
MLDADRWRSASHANAFAHLTGPLAAGAQQEAVPIGADGRAEVRPAREPVLLAAPRQAVGLGELELTASVEAGGAALRLAPLTFAPHTEPGAFLLLHRPPPQPEASPTVGFAVVLELRHRPAGGGPPVAVPAGELNRRVELRLVEGVMGSLVYAVGAEKQRIRRQAAEIQAIRSLDAARADALDRLGRELAVPRFPTELAFREGAPRTEGSRESDADYRRRLRIYRPWHVPSRTGILRLLNGEGSDSDPNAGLLGELGFEHRFSLADRGNDLAFGVKLVEVGDAGSREAFLRRVRGVHLVWPLRGAGDEVHRKRFLPAARREQDEQLRSELRDHLGFDAAGGPPAPAEDPALARPLAVALLRAAKCRRALGIEDRWPVLRAQDATMGSRYELGLGADVHRHSIAELELMAERQAASPQRVDVDAETAELLRSLEPRSASDDPDGRWLLEPCGLRTVHRLAPDRLYVSHLFVDGMKVVAPDRIGTDAEASVTAQYEAPGDVYSLPTAVLYVVGVGAPVARSEAPRDAFALPTAVLYAAVTRAESRRAALGEPAWELLAPVQAEAAWSTAIPVPPEARETLSRANLPVVTEPVAVARELSRLPAEMMATIRLAPVQSRAIVAGAEGAAEGLRRIADELRGGFVNALLPLVLPGEAVVLVAAVTRLPEAGTNLSRRLAVGFQWQAVPIAGGAATVERLGSRVTVRGEEPGLVALVSRGYSRREPIDPYELAVGLPPHARLSLVQYEFLMNLLEHANPAGIAVETGPIREGHVDLTGDGAADRLDPSTARMYRSFRPRWAPLAGDVFAPETPGFQLGKHSRIATETLLKPAPDNPGDHLP